jgi:hypothetical protein
VLANRLPTEVYRQCHGSCGPSNARIGRALRYLNQGKLLCTARAILSHRCTSKLSVS